MVSFPFRMVALVAGSLVACSGGSQDRGAEPPLSAARDATARTLMKIAEVDPTRLSSSQRGRLVQLAESQKCPCSGQGTLAECADPGQNDTCIRAPFAVRSIIRGVVRNEEDKKIVAMLLERFGPREPEEIDVSDAPCRGKADAPVLMVVFSDFECPFCSMAQKLTAAVEGKAGDRLRVCFKHWPLSKIHPRAQLAAQAGVAAQLQGKFWPMHDLMFDNRKALDRSDLETYASQINLDLDRFRTDLDSQAVKDRVRKDTLWARRLNLSGTPAFLINGRRMTDRKSVPDFLDWIAEAMALKKNAPEKQTPAAATQPAEK